MGERLAQDVALAGDQVFEHGATGLGGGQARDASIVRVLVAQHEAVVDQAVDERGDGGGADAERGGAAGGC